MVSYKHKVFLSYHHEADQEYANGLRDYYGKQKAIIDKSMYPSRLFREDSVPFFHQSFCKSNSKFKQSFAGAQVLGFASGQSPALEAFFPTEAYVFILDDLRCTLLKARLRYRGSIWPNIVSDLESLLCHSCFLMIAASFGHSHVAQPGGLSKGRIGLPSGQLTRTTGMPPRVSSSQVTEMGGRLRHGFVVLSGVSTLDTRNGLDELKVKYNMTRSQLIGLILHSFVESQRKRGGLDGGL